MEVPQYDHDLVQSVHEVSCDDVDTTMDQTKNNQDGVENGMEILNLFCLTMEWYISFQIVFGFRILVPIAMLLHHEILLYPSKQSEATNINLVRT